MLQANCFHKTSTDTVWSHQLIKKKRRQIKEQETCLLTHAEQKLLARNTVVVDIIRKVYFIFSHTCGSIWKEEDMIGVVLDANIDIVVGHGYYQNYLLTG